MRANSVGGGDGLERDGSDIDTGRRYLFEEWLRLQRLRPLRCCLTIKDYGLLEHLLIELHGDEEARSPLLAQFIRAKLADADLVFPEDVGAEVATLNSRILFVVDGGVAEPGILVQREDEMARHPALSIRTLLGAILLGMRVGQRAPLLRGDARVGEVLLESVVFQPEAARRAAA